MIQLEMELVQETEVELEVDEHVGGIGEADYNRLLNKPKINGRELQGDRILTGEDIGMGYADNFDIESMFKD